MLARTKRTDGAVENCATMMAFQWVGLVTAQKPTVEFACVPYWCAQLSGIPVRRVPRDKP